MEVEWWCDVVVKVEFLYLNYKIKFGMCDVAL